MAKKEFSKFFIASLKRTAQNVYPLVRRKTKLLAEIADKQAELESIQAQIEGYQVPIKEATGGYTTEDLITRVVLTTDKVDKDGKPIKVTQYNLTYPDTIVPEDNPDPTMPENENERPVCGTQETECVSTPETVRAADIDFDAASVYSPENQ